MGMLHVRRDEVGLAELVRIAQAIAVVRPADPPEVIEDVSVGGAGPDAGPDVGADRPRAPVVRYRRAFRRYAVEGWLRAPVGGPAHAVIEVAAPGNEGSARDAQDAAHGMLGHVHHVVSEPVLVGVPDAWRAVDDKAGAARIVFLDPTSLDGRGARFAETRPGLSLPAAALDAVVRLLPPAPARSRRWSPRKRLAVRVAAGLVLAALAAVLLLR